LVAVAAVVEVMIKMSVVVAVVLDHRVWAVVEEEAEIWSFRGIMPN
jgi:hypothetical protein